MPKQSALAAPRTFNFWKSSAPSSKATPKRDESIPTQIAPQIWTFSYGALLLVLISHDSIVLTCNLYRLACFQRAADIVSLCRSFVNLTDSQSMSGHVQNLTAKYFQNCALVIHVPCLFVIATEQLAGLVRRLAVFVHAAEESRESWKEALAQGPATKQYRTCLAKAAATLTAPLDLHCDLMLINLGPSWGDPGSEAQIAMGRQFGGSIVEIGGIVWER